MLINRFLKAGVSIVLPVCLQIIVHFHICLCLTSSTFPKSLQSLYSCVASYEMKSSVHPVIFRHEHPSILREAFSAMYRYVNVCKCKLISRERIRQILINNFIAVSLGKTTTCIWLNIGEKIEKYEQACTMFLVSIVFKRATWNFEKERNKSKF